MKSHFDLIITGGGQAGVAAALAAGRRGLDVLLCEAEGALGGSATNCLVNPFMPTVTVLSSDGKEEVVNLSKGIYEEIFGDLHADTVFGLYRGGGRVFHEEVMKILYDRKLADAGVTVLFHATLCDVKREGRMIKSLSFATVGGVLEFTADSYIDATGDATLTYMAGSPTHLGRPVDNLCQPMTMCFRLANVDIDDFNAHRAEINPLYKQFQAEGKIKNPREDVLIFPSMNKNMLHFNTTRIVKLNPTDPFDRSKAEALGREQVVEMFKFLKENFSAFANADLVMTASAIGVRESRMIDARHILTAEEIVAGTHFEDGIAAGNYEIDIHSPDGSGTSHYFFPKGVYYTIPYRTMLPSDLDNLLVAGRSIGATHEAQASIRIMPICMCLGEAAGIAAYVAKRENVTVGDTDASLIRAELHHSQSIL